jgi:hypothetical protein
MEMNVCQSCGMPMGNTDELYGTEKDGSKSADYCKYCYQGGAFTFQGTMEEMMDFCVKPLLESDPNMTEPQARQMMAAYFPMLKRWQKA